jgi:catechol 2,3-dioxygenase-like lactoylglutathione lyase family enzyme
MDYKLELVIIPVSDMDRAKDFYVTNAGFRLDVDHRAGEDFRIIQLTPPGSACSITIGKGITEATPGSFAGANLVIEDADEAHAELTGRGVEVSEIQEMPWGRFVFFADPDGNRWSLQQIPAR